MRAARVIAVAAAVAATLGACGSDSGSGGATTAATTTTTAVATTATAVATTTPVTPTTQASTITTTVAEQQQAIWPAAGVVFTTPEAAAQDFVSKALGVPPVLGPFAQGDTRSGEIDVFSPARAATPPGCSRARWCSVSSARLTAGSCCPRRVTTPRSRRPR